MTRSPAWMLSRVAWTLTGAVTIVAPGAALTRLPAVAEVRQAQCESPLQVVIAPPRLLEIPSDCRPVGLDFVPPTPHVQGHGTPPPTAAPQHLPAAPHPRLAASTMQRLPQVESSQRRPSYVAQAPVLNAPGTLLIDRLDASRPAPITSSTAAPAPTAQPPAMQHVVETPPAVDPAMRAVCERAFGICQQAERLADRGAYFSARSEFIQALRVITQALDTQSQQTVHSQALAEGLRALQEADDFAPQGSRLEADLDLRSIVASHRTPVLKGANLAELTPLIALQQYYTFAQQRLALAGGGQPAASQALYGVGRLAIVLAERSPDERRLHAPKAMALFHAALANDANNWRAAHELGVLYAQFGQLPEAKRLLLQSASLRPRKETWQNLAVVHDRLGEADLAKKARFEMQLVERQTPARATSRSGLAVDWVDASQFADKTPVPSQPAARSAAVPATKGSSPTSWFK